tara:strand:+ start:1800 stop:2111 length:312 start_codon:yes stop_codon:yes gene_type:complete
MTAKQMIELVQQHHPHMKETEILLHLNNVKDEFCENTGIVKDMSYAFTTVANQLLYDVKLSADMVPGEANYGILTIKNVWVGDSPNRILASRLQGTLKIKDLG